MSRTPKYATERQYRPYIDIIKKDLGIYGMPIIFNFRHFTKYVGCAFYDHLTSYGEVSIDNRCTRKRTITILMHELRHVQQFYTKRLDKWYNGYGYWEGVRYKVTNSRNQFIASYNEFPWEIDAVNYEREAIRLFPELFTSKLYIGSIGNIKFYKDSIDYDKG